MTFDSAAAFALPLDRPVLLPIHAVVCGQCACGNVDCPRTGKHVSIKWRDITYDAPAPRPAPGAGVAIRTGAHPKGSDCFVVDLDGEAAALLFDSMGPCPETFTVRTPRAGGGWHLYFNVPSDFSVKTSAGDLGKGIDIRGDGGIVVAPGSPHANGGTYEVIDDSPLADSPAWLLEWLRAQKVNLEAQVYPGDVTDPVELERRRILYARYLAEEAPARGPALRGQGDATLFTVVQRGAYDLALPVDDVLELVERYYDPRCSPPWGPELEERVHHKAHDAKTGSTRPRAEPLPADLAHLAGGTPPVPVAAEVVPMPVASELPAFPVDALPPVLRAFVLAEAEATQTPVDLAAMLVLGVCSAAVAGKISIEVARGYIEPLCLFIVVALLPGERKSAVFNSAFAPLRAAEREKAELSAPLISAAKTARDLLVDQIKRSKSELAKLKPAEQMSEWFPNQHGTLPQGGAAIRRQIGEMEARLRKLEVPAEPQLFADDVTMERLGGLMGEQGGRMCIASPEGTLFGIISGRYSQKGQSSFEILLKGHAGDPHRVDRQSKERPSIFIERACLTLALAVQPSVIQALSADPAMKGQGLLARFLYSLPASKVGSREIDSAPVPDAVREAYHAAVMKLTRIQTPEETAVLGQQVSAEGDLAQLFQPKKAEVPSIKLSAEAKALHRALCAEVEPRLEEGVGDLSDLAGWGSKWAGAVARISGVLHVFEHGPTGEVSATTMGSAIEIGRYLERHAAKAFGVMATPPEESDAKALLGWLVRTKATSFALGDVSSRMRPRAIARSKPRRAAAIAELVERGLVTPEGKGWRVAC